MATSFAAARARAPAELAGAETLARPDDYEPGQSRLLHGATRWYATPVCAMLSHKWAPTPWSRWALGWDRETTCLRCGQLRHERARLTADHGSHESH
jgi:hypothetical protein